MKNWRFWFSLNNSRKKLWFLIWCYESEIMWNRTSCLFLLLMASLSIRPGGTCTTAYTKSPLLGYRCVMDDPSNLMTLTNTARPQCVWRCLSLRDCMVVSHNGVDDTCELAMQRCERLAANPDFSVNVYGIDRGKCAHWVSKNLYNEQKSVVFPQGANAANKTAVARLALNNMIYPGKFTLFGGIRIYVAQSATNSEISRSGQVLHLSPTCQPAWIPYSPSNSSPVSRAGVLAGCRIGQEPVYVARARFNGIYSIGYYRHTTKQGYFVIEGDARTTSANDMEILVLM